MLVRVLLFLQTNKLACDSFLCAGGRDKILGSEMKGGLLLTAVAVAGMSALWCWFFRPNSMTRWYVYLCSGCSGLRYSQWTLNLEDSNLL